MHLFSFYLFSVLFLFLSLLFFSFNEIGFSAEMLYTASNKCQLISMKVIMFLHRSGQTKLPNHIIINKVKYYYC